MSLETYDGKDIPALSGELGPDFGCPEIFLE
jgi:hypothetical protein